MKQVTKKTKIIAIIVAIVAIIGIAGIFAYFTDVATVTNKAKVGIVDIKLDEYMIDSNNNKVKWQNEQTILPGQTISKIPEISCVKGSADCYIRAKVEISAKDKDLNKHSEMLTLDNLNIDTDKWYYCKEDGYFYYKNVLTDKSESVILFTEVTVPSKWDNTWSLQELSIDVTAEAIQEKNFTPDFSENSKNPWPGITKDDIEVCKYPDHVK